MRTRIAWVVMGLVLLAGHGVRAQAPLPEKMTIALGGGVKMDFVLIKPGTFMMGSEKGDADAQGKPVHQVRITKPFYLGVYEVTQAQWKALIGNNPSYFTGDDLPVEQVSWEDCQTFLAKLKEKLGEGMTCRLPTEAEWEYACRAGSKTEYCFGDDPGSLGEYAWFDGNSTSMTHPVGQKKPNAWGLYDMHGNVWEWCADWMGDYGASAATDPTGPPSGIGRVPLRVLRGSSWGNYASYCRCAIRFGNEPSSRDFSLGFRVVCGVSPR